MHLILIIIALFVGVAYLATTGRYSARWATHPVRRYVAPPVLFVTIVLTPILGFLLTSESPTWRGAVRVGAVDSWSFGKLYLSPIALVGSISLWFYEFDPRRFEKSKLVAVGLAVGALVYTAWLSFDLVTRGIFGYRASAVTCIPLYMSAWIGLRLIGTAQASGAGLFGYTGGALVTAGLGALSVVETLERHKNLATVPPDCFVVTAASQGHTALVGRRQPGHRRHVLRYATLQLWRFWIFEDLWQRCLPRSHAKFRSVYNHWGYAAAAWIDRPWSADVVYLILKPLEWSAVAIVWVSENCKKHAIKESKPTIQD